MEQAAIISHTVNPDGNATFLLFIPSEQLGQPHYLNLDALTADCLAKAKAEDPEINYDPERPHVIGWATGMQALVPCPVGPVNLDGDVIKDWKGIQYTCNLEPETHVLRGECRGDLNGLLSLKGVNIGIERVVTHL